MVSRKIPRVQQSDINYSFPVFQILEGRALECYDDYYEFFMFSENILFNKYELFNIIDGIDFL